MDETDAEINRVKEAFNISDVENVYLKLIAKYIIELQENGIKRGIDRTRALELVLVMLTHSSTLHEDLDPRDVVDKVRRALYPN